MANFPLEIIYPKQTAVFPDGVDANNRCNFAYPGLPFSIQACGIGGDYETHVWSLSNAPAGMEIDPDTGEITWPNPTTGTHSDIVVTVEDGEASSDSETWSIVCGTSGWFFVDPLNGHASAGNGGGGSAGTGTISNPWLTIDDVYDGSGANGRVYFRYPPGSSPYTFANVPVSTGGTAVDNRWVFSSGSRAVIWIAYPGDPQPVIDFGSNHADDDDTPALRPGGPCIYFDGLTFLNGFNKTLWVDRTSRRGAHFRNCTWDTFGPPVLESSNSAGIMYTALYGGGEPNTQAYGDVVYGCTFINPFGDMPSFSTELTVAIKQYSWLKGLVANCTFTQTLDPPDVTGWYEAVSQKSNCRQCEVRGSVFTNAAWGGNFNVTAGSDGDECSAEIRFNYFDFPTQNGLHLFHSKSGINHGVWVNRNTLRTRLLIETVTSSDGPYVWEDNVIVNADGGQSPWPFIQDASISDASRVTANIPSNPTLSPTGVQNLAGASSDGIIDASGSLIGTYRGNFLGLKGWEFAEQGEGSPPLNAITVCVRPGGCL